MLCSLRIQPVKAYLPRKLDTMSQNDAYIKFELGTQKERTSTKQDQKKPTWDQTFEFAPSGNNQLKIVVMDEDELADQEIATGYIDLTPYMQARQPAEKFVSLKFNKKPAGKVLLKITPVETQSNHLQGGLGGMSNHVYQPNQQPMMMSKPIYQEQRPVNLNQGSTHVTQSHYIQPAQSRYISEPQGYSTHSNHVSQPRPMYSNWSHLK